MNKDMQIIREVNDLAENFYEDAAQLGNHAAYALKKAHRSQMTGLENIAESAFKTSDVFDYIKRQIARLPYWRQGFPEYKEHPDEGFGERLKKYLEDELAPKRDALCRRLEIGDKNEDRQARRRIYLLLIRQFIRQVVVHYEYQVSFENGKKGS